MELRVLQYFLTVAEEENFTKAAERLHITQPTLSRQIAALEDELGARLFDRNKHKVTLTDDGLTLRRRAREIITLADKTKRDFLHKNENLEGIISIGSGEFLSSKVLTECIAEFNKIYPLVQYEFYSGNADNICENIERGLLDIGLVMQPIDVSKYEYLQMPVKEQNGVYVHRDSPLALKEAITPKDLAGMQVIAPVSSLQSNNVKKWLGEYGADVHIAARGNLLYNQISLAQSGIGAVIGIRLNYDFADLCFVPLAPKQEIPTALIWKKEQRFSAAASAFIDFLTQYLKGITDNKI